MQRGAEAGGGKSFNVPTNDATHQHAQAVSPGPAPSAEPAPQAAAAAAGPPAGAAAAAERPLHWDEHLARGLADARAAPGGVPVALARFVAGKLSGELHKRPPRLSDIVWGALGMGVATAALAALAARVRLMAAAADVF